MVVDEINPTLCNGCGICVNSCPMDVLRMDEESQKTIIKYPEDCMLCGFCIEYCPEKAIHISRGYYKRPIILGWG
jgi:NAD-dependent dihydropyrimidine dehydrogenase PreA subunit